METLEGMGDFSEEGGACVVRLVEACQAGDALAVTEVRDMLEHASQGYTARIACDACGIECNINRITGVVVPDLPGCPNLPSTE